MARLAQVVGRRSGPVFMREMLATLEVGEYVDVPDDLALGEPGWTLFDFDLAENEAVLVQTQDLDLSVAPFCYQAQYSHARAILRLKFDVFVALGAAIQRRSCTIHLFNIGHCGSTLLHAAFNGSGAAFCLSEPLFTFQLALARHDMEERRITELMRSGLGFLRRFPGAERGPLVVKHFSQATPVIAAFQAAEPMAQSVFMDRGAEDWCASVYGFWQRMGVAPPLNSEQRHTAWWILTAGRSEIDTAGILDLGENGSSLEENAALAWVMFRRDHAAATQTGLRLVSLRYETLVADRHATMAGLFLQLGLPAAGLEKALRSFEFDSHAGTASARDVPVTPLSPQGRARVRALLAHRDIGLVGDEPLD